MAEPVPVPEFDEASAEELRALGRALALGEGFSLHLVSVAGGFNGTLVTSEAAFECARMGGRARSRHIDPYAGHSVDAGPLDPATTITSLLGKLETPSPDEIVWLDLTRAPAPLPWDPTHTGRDDLALRALFRRLNERRNQIADKLDAPLVLVAAPRLLQAFVEEAPDFWSIRSLAIRLRASADRSALRVSLGVADVTPRGDPDEIARVEREVAEARARVAGAPDALVHKTALVHLLIAQAFLLRQARALAEGARLNREAVELARQLVLQDGRLEEDLALALNNLGNALRALGDPRSSLATTQEAAQVYAKLSKKEPATFGARFVMSLNNLGNCFAQLGEQSAALSSTEHAVQVARQLAADDDRIAARSLLAASLDNLGRRLASSDDHAGALAATSEATTLYRELAAQAPDRFKGDLAACLLNLGVRLSTIGDREAALAVSSQAVALYRDLVAVDPMAELPFLAGALRNLGRRHAALGDYESAIHAAREGLVLSTNLVRGGRADLRAELQRGVDGLQELLQLARVDPEQDAQISDARALLVQSSPTAP